VNGGDMENPYRPDALASAVIDARVVTPHGSMERPAVVGWFKVYCSVIGTIYIAVAIAGAALALYAQQLSDSAEETMELVIQGYLYLALGIVLAGVHFLALLIPRKKWSWIYGFAPIVIGLTSLCCLPMTIPLLLWWIKPGTRAWFGA
jgi:hypothetical protein